MRETNSKQLSWLRTAALVVLLFAVAAVARAQYSSGIKGTVVDQDGAAVPNAKVTLTNQDTQVAQTALSNTQGFVQILEIPPGRYQVTVSATGFTSWEEKAIDIVGNDIRTIYPKLTVGSLQSTVSVTAAGAAVETTSGTIS